MGLCMCALHCPSSKLFEDTQRYTAGQNSENGDVCTRHQVFDWGLRLRPRLRCSYRVFACSRLGKFPTVSPPLNLNTIPYTMQQPTPVPFFFGKRLRMKFAQIKEVKLGHWDLGWAFPVCCVGPDRAKRKHTPLA
jgi:hypothetical protein